MTSKKLWYLVQLSRRLWVRASLIACLAILSALLAPVLSPIIPDSWAERFGRDAVLPLLDVLTGTMLTVVTFSLSVMVTAHLQAASQVTPRAHRMLKENTVTQTVLATFLGAFIFALTCAILFRAHVYTARGSVVVFAFTILVVLLVVLSILRWIDQLSDLGSMDETLREIEARTRETLKSRQTQPTLGARELTSDLPETGVPIRAVVGGYVRFIDTGALAKVTEERDCDIHLAIRPGDWLRRGQVLAMIGKGDTRLASAVLGAITLSDERNFDQDPRYGLSLFGEAAARALSPGLNDPATAIDAIARLERLFLEQGATTDDPQIDAERLWMPAVTGPELLESGFDVIARDGAGKIEVALRLLEALRAIADTGDAGLAQGARELAARAAALADQAQVLDTDRARLRDAAAFAR
ncbi:DUF2254 domain-containing protein [Actibacterium ureilyticum]|uniref:DUF2254 domain-containing protein n=1 Tax=Actibacterium ureilyticum TaxID=1590614 RepID=UPI001595B51F|nr:DUF2254 domain-containing protein [Actibacterium ureilyticum]